MTTQAQEPQNLEVQVLASPVHGLFYMIECLIDVPHRSPEMASTLRGRIGNWGPVRDALDDWGEHVNSDALASLRFPEVQGQTPTLSTVLEKVALESKDGQDLANKAAPWLGPKAAASFEHVLTTVEPLYHQYYWPGGALERKKTEILNDLRKGQFQKNFAKVAAFYRGQMPPGTQPTIALIPYVKGIMEDKVRTRGHNSGNLQVAEVVMGQDDPDRAGVCFHEFAHALWSGQNEEEQKRWEDRFASHGLVGKLAYAQLNEGLATAIGNGWFDQKVQGVLSSKPWYADPVIATYSRALFPIIENALDEGRPPTDSELDKMVDAFKEELPEATSTFDVVAAIFTTISSRQEIHQSAYQQELMRLGPVRSSRARGWDSTKPNQATFTLLWLQGGEKKLLLGRGWSQQQIAFRNYGLRQTEQGWEFAFIGEHDELFKLLRRFQSEGLKESW